MQFLAALAPQTFIAIRELQITKEGCAVQGRIVAQSLLVRGGEEGATPKWECFFIDQDDAESVRLAEALGQTEHRICDKMIARRLHLRAGELYRVTKRQIYSLWQQHRQDCDFKDGSNSQKGGR